MLIITACACNAVAQVDSTSQLLLEEVEVVAEKQEYQSQRLDAGQQVSKEEIAEIAPDNASDLLRYFSGVQLKDYGGVGGLKTISVRGLNATHVLHLVDEVPVTDIQSGMVDLSLVPALFLSSADVSKSGVKETGQLGASYTYASTLRLKENIYQWSEDSLSLRSRIGLGSFSTYRGDVEFIKQAKKIQVGLSAGGIHSLGNYTYEYTNGENTRNYVRDNADVKRWYVHGGLLYKVSGKSLLKSKFYYEENDRGLPGAVVDYAQDLKRGQRLYGNRVGGQLEYVGALKNGGVRFISSLQERNTNYEDLDFLNDIGRLEKEYHQTNWFNSAQWNSEIVKHLDLNVALDYDFTSFTSNDVFVSKAQRNQWISGANLSYRLGKFSTQLNTGYMLVRDDLENDSEDFSAFTPGMGVSYRPSWKRQLLFHAHAKRSVRLPTFGEQYIGSSQSRGLAVEKSNQFSLGSSFDQEFKKVLSSLSFRLDGFYSLIEDKIVGIPSQNLFLWSYRNFGEVDIYGIDANMQLFFKPLGTFKPLYSINYTYQKSRNLSFPTNDSYGKPLPYMPEHSFSQLIGVEKGAWMLRYETQFVGQQYRLSVIDENYLIDSWVVHDVSLSRKFNLKSCELQIQVQAKNIFNHQYEVIAYYPMPGRSFNLNLFLVL